MKYRKLRVAWSVASGIIPVLLVALWVRSYAIFDICGVTFAAERRWNLASENGRIFLIVPDYESLVWAIGKSREWDIRSQPWSTFAKTEEPIIYARGFEGYYRIIIPDAMFASLFVGFALAPWVRWRFTLRTLLIATTLIAVGLGTIIVLSS